MDRQSRMDSNVTNWSWNGRVVEKFTMSLLNKGEPDNSNEG